MQTSLTVPAADCAENGGQGGNWRPRAQNTKFVSTIVIGAACSVFGPSKDAALLEGSKIFMKVGLPYFEQPVTYKAASCSRITAC